MKTIKNVDVFSLAKTQGIFGAILGFFGGLFYGAIFMIFGSLLSSGSMDTGAMDGSFSPGIGAGLGLGMIILLPIMYGVIGFIGGLVGGILWNLVVKVSGGIKVNIVDEGEVLPVGPTS